jgi:isochorismate pyruvate lyase
MTPCDTLADVRSAIDQIDTMLVGLLAERGRYVTEAARFKRDAAEVAAPARAQLLRMRQGLVQHLLGAAPEVVEAVYRAMVPAFVALEARQHQTLGLAQAQ